MIWSRGRPAPNRRGPLVLVAKTPPSVARSGCGGVDQEPLALLGEDRPEGREGDPGLDGDRHVGGRVVDDPVERPGVDRDARARGGCRRSRARCRPPGGRSRAPAATRSRDGLAEGVDGLGAVGGRGVTAVAEPAAGRGVGPGQGGVSGRGLGSG